MGSSFRKRTLLVSNSKQQIIVCLSVLLVLTWQCLFNYVCCVHLGKKYSLLPSAINEATQLNLKSANELHEEDILGRDFRVFNISLFVPSKHVSSVQKRRAALSNDNSTTNNNGNHRGPEQSNIRKSAYICEDGTLQLSCTTGKHIDVLRANFGRFSITLCNPSGFLDWSVNCASGNSLSVLMQSCSGQQECSIKASSSLFGDPCPSTSKYLEVHYRCSSGTEIELNRNSSSTISTANDEYHPAVEGNNDGKVPSTSTTISSENLSSRQTTTGQRAPPPSQSSMDPLLANTELIAAKAGLNQDILRVWQYLNYDECSQAVNSTNSSGQLDYFKCEPAAASTANMHLNNTNHTHAKVYNGSNGGGGGQSSSIVSTSAVSMAANSAAASVQQSSSTSSIVNSNTINQGTMNDYMATVRDWNRSQTPHRITPPASVLPTFSSTNSIFCPFTIYRYLEWPITPNDSIAVRSCPQDASGTARWRCLAGSQTSWQGLPDLSGCNSHWLAELNSFQNVNNFRNDIWKSILATLQRSAFYGGDIVSLTSILQSSLQNIYGAKESQLNLANANLQHLTSFDALFEVISFLLSKDNVAVWLDLPALKRETTALELLNTAMKYTALYCLDKRQLHSDKEINNEWRQLIISCYSIPKLLHEFQLTWTTGKDISRKFKFKLFASSTSTSSQQQLQQQTSSSGLLANVSVYMILSEANMQAIINEDILFGSMIPFNLEHYFVINSNRTEKLYLKEQELHDDIMGGNEGGKDVANVNVVNDDDVDSISKLPFLNSNLVKLFKFNNSQMHEHNETSQYSFEIIFRHLHVDSSFLHRCVHWHHSSRQWIGKHCSLIESNVSHSTCRCQTEVTVALLASPIYSNQYNPLNYIPIHLLAEEPSILPLILIAYMWIALLLTRCHDSFFNRFNFGPLLVVCVLRTLIELSTLANWFWSSDSWTSGHRCKAVLFCLLYQMEVISAVLTVFIFQNVILLILVPRLYLGKDYVNCLHALTKCRQMQLFIALLIPFAQLLILFLVSNPNSCWPQFGEQQTVNLLFMLSPFVQSFLVVMSGLILLHARHKIFSEYGYPKLQCINMQTNLLEKYVKSIFCRRCKHSLLWLLVTCVYLLAVLAPFCRALALANLSIGLIVLDMCLSLVFLLFGRIKFISPLMDRCYHHSSPSHNSSNKELSSNSSIRDNSISVLSDSSKSYLTLPSQISSVGKMLNSPKIHPSPSRFSNTYGRNSNQSAHLYESPRHLYKHELERVLWRGTNNHTNGMFITSEPRNSLLHPTRTGTLMKAKMGLESVSGDNKANLPYRTDYTNLREPHAAYVNNLPIRTGPQPPPPPHPSMITSNHYHRSHFVLENENHNAFPYSP